MKTENIKFMEIPERYNSVIDRLKMQMDPHYIEWRGHSYWVMEHRWDDMVQDIHVMMERYKAENDGKVPPDLILKGVDPPEPNHAKDGGRQKNHKYDLEDLITDILFFWP